MNRKPSNAGVTSYDVKDDGPAYVGIIFCPECNNMLYPREDKENKVVTRVFLYFLEWFAILKFYIQFDRWFLIIFFAILRYCCTPAGTASTSNWPTGVASTSTSWRTTLTRSSTSTLTSCPIRPCLAQRSTPVPSAVWMRQFSSRRRPGGLRTRWGCTTCAPTASASTGGPSNRRLLWILLLDTTVFSPSYFIVRSCARDF